MISVLLPRPRLHDRLDRPDSRLTVVTAPSGFGKTSLVRGWVETVGADDVVWVALGTEVVSRSGFWQAVLTSAARLGLAADLPALMTEIDRGGDPAATMAGVLGGGSGPDGGRRRVLVVDAYERMREMTAQVDLDLARLVELAPGLQLVVTTRTGSGLASPVRSLRGEVQLLTERDLAFTPDETRDLLAAFAAPDVAAAADRVHRVTRGYPLALRAVMLSLARTGTMPAPGSADWQRLVAEDLRGQLAGGAAYEFVLATCLPPYFDADLARDVTGRTDVKEQLDDLEWNGFGRWIPFAPGRQVFQYVDSLREAMRADVDRLDRRDRERGAGLCAEWFHRNGDLETAFELALGAGLFAIAARVYAKLVVGNQDAVGSDRFDRHLAGVPSRALTQFPALAFGRGLACHRNPALRGAAAEYFEIPAAWTGPRSDDMTPGEILLGHVSKVAALRLLGRFDQSGRAAEQGLAFYDSMRETEQDQLADLAPMALRHLAYSLFQAGRVGDAHGTVGRAIAATTSSESRNYTVVYGVGLNALDGRAAEARAARGLVVPEAWRPGQTETYVNALGRIGQAALLLDEMDFAGAIAEYDGCEAFRDTSEFWPFLTWTLMHARLGLGLAAAEARRVEEALRRTPSPPGTTDSLGAAAVRGALAVLWLATGDRTKAASLLKARTRYGGQHAPAVLLGRLVAGDHAAALAALPALEARPGHTVRSTAAVVTLGAAAAARSGNDDTAVALLERALALVGPGGARAHLMYLPAEDLTALRALADSHPDREVGRYLAGPVPAILAGATAVTPLTPQELAVVAAYVRNVTRAAVAAELFLSENTVKTHLQRIYRKLGVRSREGVIERAIELDLLTP